MSAPPLMMGIQEFCDRHQISKNTAYREITLGRLKAVKIGRRTGITIEDAAVWRASLPALAQEAA